jgi:hypothetical protein
MSMAKIIITVASASLLIAGPALAKEAAKPDVKTIALTKAAEIDRDLDTEHRAVSDLSRALVKDASDIAQQLTTLSDALNAQGTRALRDQLQAKIDGLASQVNRIQDDSRKLNSRYANLGARDVYKITVSQTDGQGQTRAVVGHPRDDIEVAVQREEIESAARIVSAAMDKARDAITRADLTSGAR